MVRLCDMHPSVTAAYAAAVVGIGMFIQNPVLQFLSLAGALSFIIVSGSASRRHILPVAGIAAAVAFLNPLISHRGSTVLLYVNGNPCTLEALAWGANSGIMIAAVLFWTFSFSKIMTVEKVICLAGGLSPRIAAVISSAVRHIPLFGRYYSEISSLRKAGVASDSDLSPAGRIRDSAAAFSATVGLALETGIDAADSMDARGWGAPGRRSFSRFSFTRRDTAVLIFIAAAAGIEIAAGASGVLGFDFYPSLCFSGGGPSAAAAYALFALLSFFPAANEAAWRIFWKKRKTPRETDVERRLREQWKE